LDSKVLLDDQGIPRFGLDLRSESLFACDVPVYSERPEIACDLVEANLVLAVGV
jgi:hypothetical protein